MKNAQKILISAIGLVLATGMAISQPTITPSGESLTVAGVEASNGAILRVAGPNGYRFVREFSAGENAAIDLKNTPFTIDGEKLSALLAGSYSYELLSRPGGEVVRGTFDIGTADEVASETTPSEPTAPNTAAQTRAETFEDNILLNDSANDGKTWISLESGLISDANWKLVNQDGTFKLATGGSMVADPPDVVARMIVARDGDVKFPTGGLEIFGGITTGGAVAIGTSIPILPLEVRNENAVIGLTDNDGGVTWKLANNEGTFSLGYPSAPFVVTKVVVVEDGSLANSLVINSSGVSVLSSRAAKTNIKPTSAEQVLAELEKLPIYTWSYTEDDNKAVHIGPMAEEFHQQFGFGDDAKRISALDTGGLALAGVKALQQKLDKRDAEIAELQETVALLLEKVK